MPEEAVLVKRLVDSYETLTTESHKICSFTLITADGKHSNENLTDICHANLKYVVPDKYDVLLTSYPADEEADFRFFTFMVGRLYKKWAEYVHLEQTEDDKYYIRITDLDKIPANIVYNFCICSRVIVEYRKFLGVWDELVLKDELDPVVAFAICQFLSLEVDEPVLDRKIYSPGYFENHWPFDNTVNLARLINGEPDSTGESYKSLPRECAPTNFIWGQTTHLRKLEGSTIRKFWNEWKEKCPN